MGLLSAECNAASDKRDTYQLRAQTTTGFLSAIADYENEEKIVQGSRLYQKLAHNLDPLWRSFCTYHSQENLESMIEGLFRYMDVDGSGSITFAEFKHGVEKLDMNPRMVVTIDDFEDFVDYKSLHNSQEDKDEMNQEEFSFCMRLAIRDYICRLVSHQMNESVRYSKDVSTDYLAYKSMMTDMQQIHQILERLEPSQGQVSRRGSLSSDVAREGTTIANKSARNNLRKQGKSEGNDQLTDIQQQLTLLYQMVSSQQGIIQVLDCLMKF